jgi:hypothetical protein
MHDHSHDHAHGEEQHKLGEITPYEGNLVWRNQLLHIATEIYCAVLRSGAEIQPEDATQRARGLVKSVDDVVISCRVESEDTE